MQQFITGWKPSRIDTTDVISAQRMNQLAATLNLGQHFDEGDPVPLLWHWASFLDWPATAQLGPDGHPADGHFLPPIPNRRRMFAGGRLTVDQPLKIGLDIDRQSEVSSMAVKHGRSGEMLFVTVCHTYRQNSVVCLVEEQDLVYRSGSGAATPFRRSEVPLGPPPVPFWCTPAIDSALLFRFSALTGNAHRIHYDEPYATGIEGYPGLVVHGPLLAVLMAELVPAEQPVREFTFRLHKPVFLGDVVRLQGQPDGPAVDLAVVSGGNVVHASAQAVRA